MVKSLSTPFIKRGLKTKTIGKKIIYHQSVSSTMDEARQAAGRGTEEGTVIIAGEQTGGKGRLQRKWLSPPGNIALSIVLYPDISSLTYLIMVAALAAVYSIEAVTGLKADIKWPNDILTGGKKAGGILIENKLSGNKVDYAVIGIGINTDLKMSDYPEIAETATSLTSKPDKDLRTEIIPKLLNEFERLYLQLPVGKSIYKAWRGRLVTLGKRVRAVSGSHTVEGVAETVDESGALIVRQTDGNIVRVVAGDVTLRENR